MGEKDRPILRSSNPSFLEGLHKTYDLKKPKPGGHPNAPKPPEPPVGGSVQNQLRKLFEDLGKR